MREQIALRPPSRPVKRLAREEPPSWMNRLENAGSRQASFETPAPKADAQQSLKATESARIDFPVPEPLARSNSPARELRVKVWDQKEAELASPALSSEMVTPVGNDDIGDVPTKPLVADPSALAVQRNSTPPPHSHSHAFKVDEVEDVPTKPLVAGPSPTHTPPASTPPPPSPRLHTARIDEVDQLDTLPLATRAQRKSIPQPLAKPVNQQLSPTQQKTNAVGLPGGQIPSTPRFPHDVSSALPVTQLKHTSSPHPALSPAGQPKPQSRKLPAILLVLLLLAVIAALSTWIIVYQPFTIAGITQPQQSFKDNQLGFSLLYPNGWKSEVDQSKATARFHDSSQTAEVIIVVGAANEDDISKYLQQEATQLGINVSKSGTTQDTAPLLIGGVSWQQLKGTIQQHGAVYTETLLATVHSNRLYTIMQLAPQATYTDEDSLVFSAMRSSFQFIS